MTRKNREVASYSGVHAALTRERGRARNHSCCSCGEQAQEWAYTWDDPCPDERIDGHGMKFSIDLDRYRPMCKKCHVVYDKSIIGNCPKGHAYEGDNLYYDQGKRKCRTCTNDRHRGYQRTPEQRARQLELQRVRRACRRAARSLEAG